MLLLLSVVTLQRRCKRHTSARKNVKSKFLRRLRKKLACMQEILLILMRLKSLLNYPKYFFIRTTVNTWKKKCNDGNWTVIKRIGRPNLLDSGMLKNVKDIALGTRMAREAISRGQLINITTGVVRANNPNLLKEYGGNIVLTEW